jgi:eukaryotic-like serine/threonine-protein kinase
MNNLDPDFSGISSDQLAEIDAICCEFEVQRTKGSGTTVEDAIAKASPEMRPLVTRELIRIEMEILVAWDQLRSPESMLARFPDCIETVLEVWQTLKPESRRVSTEAESTELEKATSRSTQGDGSSRSGNAVHEADESLLNDGFSRFRILRNLAQGGIGNVFVAFDHDLQREVALKVLKDKFASNPTIVHRFDAEATVTGNLEHPNIVPIYATGKRADGRPYYAMRLIKGKSMQDVISSLHKSFNPRVNFRKDPIARELLFRFVTVCKAIGFAHDRGIIHRDLKPNNIMIGDFGETLIVDWGLAKRTDAKSPAIVDSIPSREQGSVDVLDTQYGTVVGTPGYMSPEQASGSTSQISTKSDIYSLGVILVQLLTNTLPTSYTDGSNPRRLENHFSVRLSRNGSAAIHAICAKALETEPEKRYARAELLAADIEAWMIGEPVSVRAESWFERTFRWGKNHPGLIGSGLASLVVGMIALSVLLGVLASKNESLREANLSEQKATLLATNNAATATRNGEEAVRQRQRVLGILKLFLVEVERGLADIPGSAAVQRNVLTTVLQKIGDISSEFANDSQMKQNNAMALVDLGDLFSRVGTKEIKLNLPGLKSNALTPLEAAEAVYAEALKIAQSLTSQDSKRSIAMIQTKQAEIYVQAARTPEAIQLLEDSLKSFRDLVSESSDASQAALDVVTSLDGLSKIWIKNREFDRAQIACEEMLSILQDQTNKLPDDTEIKRRIGVTLSRLGDIAAGMGDLELAATRYNADLAIAKQLYTIRPNDLTSKRDLCTSIDRLGNMAAKRGKIEDALATYVESLQMRQEIHVSEPTSFKAKRELFVSFMKCGDTRMLLTESAAARTDYEQCMELADAMAKIDPTNATAKQFQSLSAEVLADVCIQENQLDDALRFAKRSLELSEQLLSKDPSDRQKQDDLVIGYLKVAKVLYSMEEHAKCLEQLYVALPIVKAAYEADIGKLDAANSYSVVLLRIVQSQLAANHGAEAEKQCATAVQVLESVPEANRQDAVSQRRLVNALTMLGRAMLMNGNKLFALDTLERAKQLANEMIASDMRAEQMKADLAEIEQSLQLAMP